MPIDEFWLNVRAASRSLGAAAPIDPRPPSTPRSLAEDLDLWLSPPSVAGYDPRDFSFLPKDERDALDRAVQAFFGAADPDRPATRERVERARHLFSTILGILQLDRYDDSLAFRADRIAESFRDKIARVKPWLRDIVCEADRESTGETALWIWLVVDDERADEPGFFDEINQLENALDDYFTVNGVTNWIHLRVRTASEQEEDVEEAAGTS